MSASEKNSISELKEAHDKRSKADVELLEPKYTFCSQQGNLTGFKAVCSYKSFMTYGVGNTKKVAQRDAASNMLLKLKNNLPKLPRPWSPSPLLPSPSPLLPSPSPLLPSLSVVPQNTETEELARAFMTKYSSAENVKAASHHYPPTPESLAVCFHDINFGLKSPNSPKSETLRKSLYKAMHPIECFEKVMNEFELKFCCEQAEVDPAKAGEVYVVLLKIDFYCLTVGAVGKTLGEAIESACQQGIDTFRLYMK